MMEKLKKPEDNTGVKVEDSDGDTGNDGGDKAENGDDVKKTEDKSVVRDIYTTDEKGTYKNGAMIANFKLTIVLILSMVDFGKIVQRLYKMEIMLNGRKFDFTLSAEDFSGMKFMPVIHREVGPDAIFYGSAKDLMIAVQESLSKDIPHQEISMSTGFSSDFDKFLLPNMIITPDGIEESDTPVVDLNRGNLAKGIKFRRLSDKKIKLLCQHLIKVFSALKSHKIMFPVLGFLVLAPFASFIVGKLGKQKYVLHLKGPSGGGKTFIANLVGSFFGDFGDQMISWSGTANSIEMEGYHFRDFIFTIDDYKKAVTHQKEAIRVVQNHADNRGRSRLNSTLKPQKTPHIRGTLLSTGEDFVEDVESVTGRSIILEVEPDHNQAAGKTCKDMQVNYKGFIPRFILWVMSQKGWQENLKNLIDSMIDMFSDSTSSISNGLRIATNWAHNAAGFELFCRFAFHFGAIDGDQHTKLITEYIAIAEDHLKSNTDTIKAQNPATLFWSILEHQIATESLIIKGLVDRSTDTTEKTSTTINKKVIGKVSGDNKSVYLFPDLVMKHLVRYHREIDQPVFFDKIILRDALVRQNMIIKAGDNRIAKQVRYNDGRVQAWQFDLAEFKRQCVDIEGT